MLLARLLHTPFDAILKWPSRLAYRRMLTAWPMLSKVFF
jgi:hypothetical protein